MPGRLIPDAFYLLAGMWLLQGAQGLFGIELGRYGILPRTTEGFWHILLAPWVHHGIWHLLGNSAPFLLLGWLVQHKGRLLFWEVTLLLVIVGGLGTWALGSAGYHAGASGLVFGYWAYLIADACYTRSLKNILLATVALGLYGGLLLGLTDFRPHISWIGHASGMAAGVLIAWLANRAKRQAYPGGD